MAQPWSPWRRFVVLEEKAIPPTVCWALAAPLKGSLSVTLLGRSLSSVALLPLPVCRERSGEAAAAGGSAGFASCVS